MFGMPPSHPIVVVSDPAAMVAVVTPSVRSELPPVDVDPIVFVDVDIDDELFDFLYGLNDNFQLKCIGSSHKICNSVW